MRPRFRGLIFKDVEDDELLRMMHSDLTAKFRAEGTTADNQNDLSFSEVEAFLLVRGDRLTAQKILYRDLLHLADSDVAGYQQI